MRLRTSFYNRSFSHIYAEEEALKTAKGQAILACFPGAALIKVNRTADVFNRPRQSQSAQKRSLALLLGVDRNIGIYPASPVCPSFDQRYFYYAANVKNCVYDCAYCFLKGMYPSADICVSVNIDDYMREVDKLLTKHPVYLSVSFAGDLLALEPVLAMGRDWSEFAAKRGDLTLEMRTKCGADLFALGIPARRNVIIAYTLSPEYVITRYESGTSSFSARIRAIARTLRQGYPVRICIDPVLPIPDGQKAYEKMIEVLFKSVDPAAVRDFSIGSFRISQNYLKIMRRQYPDEAILHYPYVNKKGFYMLDDALRQRTEGYVYDKLKQYVSEDKIFGWRENKI